MIELNDETHEHIFPIAAGFGFTGCAGAVWVSFGGMVCHMLSNRTLPHSRNWNQSVGIGAGAQKPTKTWFAWIDFLTFINLLGSKPLILPGTNLGGPCGDPERWWFSLATTRCLWLFRSLHFAPGEVESSGTKMVRSICCLLIGWSGGSPWIEWTKHVFGRALCTYH